MTAPMSGRSLSDREGQAAEEFDPAALLQRCAGDPTLAAELAALFVQNVDAMLANVTAALEQRDAAALERAAHALKGMAANFGNGAAVGLAGEMEGLARNHHLDNAEPLNSHLTKAIAALRQSLQRHFPG